MWFTDAACRGMDPELLVPEPDPYAQLELQGARVVCADCPVRSACLEHALESDEPGMWGGTTRKQRKAIQSRRRTARAS
jgi:WhiB family redox-sensing transcriptional regulator